MPLLHAEDVGPLLRDGRQNYGPFARAQVFLACKTGKPLFSWVRHRPAKQETTSDWFFLVILDLLGCMLKYRYPNFSFTKILINFK